MYYNKLIDNFCLLSWYSSSIYNIFFVCALLCGQYFVLFFVLMLCELIDNSPLLRAHMFFSTYQPWPKFDTPVLMGFSFYLTAFNQIPQKIRKKKIDGVCIFLFLALLYFHTNTHKNRYILFSSRQARKWFADIFLTQWHNFDKCLIEMVEHTWNIRWNDSEYICSILQ